MDDETNEKSGAVLDNTTTDSTLVDRPQILKEVHIAQLRDERISAIDKSNLSPEEKKQRIAEEHELVDRQFAAYMTDKKIQKLHEEAAQRKLDHQLKINEIDIKLNSLKNKSGL